MAIGAKAQDVRTMFSLEAALIGAIGGAGGVILGNLVVYAMDVFGVPFESPFGSGELIIHPKVHLGVTAVIFVVGIVICVVSAISPARKASRVEPVRAFRGQIT